LGEEVAAVGLFGTTVVEACERDGNSKSHPPKNRSINNTIPLIRFPFLEGVFNLSLIAT
jgi:hypothetical protein